MITFIKNLFKRRKAEEESNDRKIKTLEGIVNTFDSLDEAKFRNADEVFEQVKSNDLGTEYFKAGLRISKAKRFEKIVCQYGADILRANEDNRKIVEEHFQNARSGKLDRTLNINKFQHRLMLKYDIKYLSNSKREIKEAIEYILKEEKNAETVNQLKAGLRILEDFIDFDRLE